ncbi:glycosyltransferase family 2 protein [Pirellulales bacterium]|nr:glycosyltransferase family 2 protein [Pirellulales bacterium]
MPQIDEHSRSAATQTEPARRDDLCIDRVDAALELAEQSVETASDIDRAQAREVASPTALSLSVIIPVYNERETVVDIVRRVQEVGVHQEIILVDDFSIDGTRRLVLELEKEPDIHVILHGYNRGKGAALRTAFAQAAGDVVIIQDADLEYDPADYPKLLAPLERGEADVVYGSRFLDNPRQDPSRLHRFGNWLLTKASNLATGQRLTDMETCYKAFRREVLAQIEVEQDRFGFEPEITAKIARLGYSIKEVPIRYHGRSYDQGKKIGWPDAVNALYCIAKYR